MYALNGKNIVQCESVAEWVKLNKEGSRNVIKTMIGKTMISTVFISLDHNYFGGTPILFETMIFNAGRDLPGLEGYQARYRYYDEAEHGHRQLVSQVAAQLKRSRFVSRRVMPMITVSKRGVSPCKSEQMAVAQ